MIACPLCASTETKPLFEKSGQLYQRCRKCRFRFAPSLSNANLDNSIDDFEPAYRQYLSPSSDDDHNHRETVAWIERYVPLDESATLLDVGAGGGKFLKYVRTVRPCRAGGVEPSAALYRAYNLETEGVANATLPEFAAAGAGQYSVVTTFDVIEHVADPLEFGAALDRVVAPGGYVFLSTPDAGALLPAMLGRFWHHHNRYHFSLFDRSTLDRLALQSGFSTVAFEHRPKRVAVTYVRRYISDFFVGSPSQRNGASRWSIPLNLFDIMSVVWRKHA